LTVSRQRLEFAAEAFLGKMRREFVKRHPSQESAVKTMAEYAPDHRSALMAALESAVVSTTPAADKAFAEWLERKADQASA
jgi:hypothetical protein